MNEPEKIHGTCLCGTVRFAITGPLAGFQACHCSRCRKNSGSAHAMNIFVSVAQFEWLDGEASVKRFELPAAQFFCSAFCTHCGSAMPWVTRTANSMVVPAGCLDDDPGERPRRQVHFASRAPWYVPVNDLPSFDEGPSSSK